MKVLKIIGLSAIFILSVSLTGYFSYTQADAGEDLAITGDTTWSAGEYTYQDITISNNATLTVEADTGAGTGTTINARNITVEVGSNISANEEGYAFNAGPSPGGIYSGYGAGGGYGGDGGDPRYPAPAGDNGLGGAAYGSVFNPTQLGSGGGDALGGSGGGAITINATGTVSLLGGISVNGGDSGHTRDGGGAGGTIKISAVSLTGSGSLIANGGNSGGDGGGGGGGRISANYTSTLSLPLANISASGGTGTYGNGEAGSVFVQNINTGDAQIAHDLILSPSDGVDADGTVRSDGQLNLNDLSISNSVTVTFKSEYTNDTDGSGIDINLTGNFEFGAGSTIDASEQGYGPLEGTGKGASDGVIGSGAGHGGAAVYAAAAPGGIEYDSAIIPSDLGSGGGTSLGGTGGGIINITCGGTANISGAIDASAGDGSSSGNRGGGGSGGTVFINADIISDSSSTGTINVDGGDGESGGYGGGGAGGRVAFYYGAMTFDSNDISVDGGRDINGPYAEDGTVFLFNTVTSDVTVSNSMTFLATEGLNSDGSIRSDGIYYFNDLTVTNSSTLTMDGYYTNDTDGNGIVLYLSGDLDVDAGSNISANGQGYISEEGQGPGQGSGALRSGSGGSHGGLGGEFAQSVAPTAVYGTAGCPYLLGSGGGECWSSTDGGTGGGAIAINVIGDATVDGDITANGDDGTAGLSTYGSGGGSGGSVYLKADNVSGAGNIAADGGAGGAAADGGGGGGGGRISLIYITASTLPAGNVTVAGGTGSVTPGRDGADGSKIIAQRTVPAPTFNLVNPTNSSTQYTNIQSNTVSVADSTATYWRPSTTAVVGPIFYDPNWVAIPGSYSVSAGEGTKTLFAWFKNDNCVVSADDGQVTIILDQTDPTLNVLSSTSVTTTESSTLVRAQATDVVSDIDNAKINGVARSVTGAGIFQATVKLDVGSNTINLQTTDGAANPTTDSVSAKRNAEDDSGTGGGSDDSSSNTSDVVFNNIDLDHEEPEDEIIDFSTIEDHYGDDFDQQDGDLYYYVNDPIIYGTGDPDSIVRIWLNNVLFETTADADGNWSYQFKDLDKGSYSLEIEILDDEDNVLANQEASLKIMQKLSQAGVGQVEEQADDQGKAASTSLWWLWLLLILIVGYITCWYLKRRPEEE